MQGASPPEVERPVSPAVAVGMNALGATVAALLLFWNLGAYPFWGDEADTVIFAQGVWNTGDTSAWYGQNLYAYRNGMLLERQKNRGTPPAPYYFTAPFWGWFGADHFGLRLPSAICTLVLIALVGRWLYVCRAGWGLTLCLTAALVLNVSLVLYGRQCRYFALATLLTTAVAYGYWFYEGSRSRLLLITAGLCLMAAVHYLHFAALTAALVVDYGLFGRRKRTLTLREWAVLCVPTAVVLAALVYVYNPLGKHEFRTHDPQTSFLANKAKLLWWSLRDMNSCEYGVGIIMACTPLVAVWRRSWELLRLLLAIFAFTVVTVLLSPQPVAVTLDADVRYLAPLIPACIALTVLTIDRTLGGRIWLTAPLIALVLFTNVLHKPWDRTAWRSTLGELIHELREPRQVAGAKLAAWLRENAKPGQSAWITPTEWLAPQIVEAPHVVYAWQLDNPRRSADYEGLPGIHFLGDLPVDWIIVFGFGNLPDGLELTKVREKVLPVMAGRGFHYRQMAKLDVYFDDRTRPELIWHWFRDEPYDRTNRAIYIFGLQRP